jgi:uncharacterized protein YndB with AHSA1/START domain
MTVVRRETEASPEDVFAVLADGWRYADWVVGAKKIRHVDESWPEPGSRFHHRVGAGPVDIADSSVCEAVDPPRSMTLKVKAWPAGAARVRIDIEPTATGSTVTMTEHPIAGPAKTFDNPVQRLALTLRNRESLRRLTGIAENGVRERA